MHKEEEEERKKDEWRRQNAMFMLEQPGGIDLSHLQPIVPDLQASMDALARGQGTNSSTPQFPVQQTQQTLQQQGEQYEEITEQTPCELHVPFGYKGKTLKVATGMALPGRKVHTMDIPADYVRVTVTEILPGYEDHEIDVPLPEIETLQDSVGTFIMWKRRDVVLSTPRTSPPPQSGHGSVHASQPLMADEERPGQPSPMSAAASDNRPPQPEPSPTVVKAAAPPQSEPSRAVIEAAAPPQPESSRADVRTLIPKTVTAYVKTPSADITKYLTSLKNNSRGSKGKEAADPRSLVQYDDSVLGDVHTVDYTTFKMGKPFLPALCLNVLPWEMRKFHDWYMMAAKEGVSMISCRIPPEVFNDEQYQDSNLLALYFDDVHRMFRLDMI